MRVSILTFPLSFCRAQVYAGDK